jgi:hypothetical protein
MLQSPQNLLHLKGILCDFFRSRYGEDISRTADLDSVLGRAAVQVGSGAPRDVPVPELNKQVLRVAREMLVAAAQAPIGDTMEGLMLKRQKELEAFMPQRPPPVPIPTPVAPPTPVITAPSQPEPPPRDTAFFISSASRDPRREPGPCRFTLSAAAGRAPNQAFEQVYTNSCTVPGTASAYVDGHPNTYGFVLNGQTFAPHVPEADRGRVHALCAIRVLPPPPASGLPGDAARLRVSRVMIGVHNRPGAPACVHVGGTTLYVLDRECAGHAVYMPVGAEAAEVRVANGRAEVEVTLPYGDGPLEGERVAAITLQEEDGGVCLDVPGGAHDVRVGDVVQLHGAVGYTLPGGDEETTRALNAWLAAHMTVTAVHDGGEAIVVDGAGLTAPQREALRAFPHNMCGILTRPLNQVALICSRRA